MCRWRWSGRSPIDADPSSGDVDGAVSIETDEVNTYRPSSMESLHLSRASRRTRAPRASMNPDRALALCRPTVPPPVCVSHWRRPKRVDLGRMNRMRLADFDLGGGVRAPVRPVSKSPASDAGAAARARVAGDGGSRERRSGFSGAGRRRSLQVGNRLTEGRKRQRSSQCFELRFGQWSAHPFLSLPDVGTDGSRYDEVVRLGAVERVAERAQPRVLLHYDVCFVCADREDGRRHQADRRAVPEIEGQVHLAGRVNRE